MKRPRISSDGVELLVLAHTPIALIFFMLALSCVLGTRERGCGLGTSSAATTGPGHATRLRLVNGNPTVTHPLR